MPSTPTAAVVAAVLALPLLLGACAPGQGPEDAAASEPLAVVTPVAPVTPTPTAPAVPTPTPTPTPTPAPTPTPQLTAAETLVAQTRAHLPRWADITVAEAEGYRSIGDAITGYEHLVHWDHAEDDTVLDPTRPESLVYRVTAEGRELVSAMYLLPPGATMADVPDLGDEAAQWHIHDDLCWSQDRRVAGVLINGRCVPGGELVVSPPMLHVWLVEHPCGPFAGLEGHGGSCDEHTHGH